MIIKTIENRILFCWLTIFLFWSISSYVIIADLRVVPTPTQLASTDPELYQITQSRLAWEAYEKEHFFDIEMGDGYVSAIENYILLITGLFGFMRFCDLTSLWRIEEKERRWQWFWDYHNL